VEIITGDADLNWSNRVTTVGWADQIFVVVARAGEGERFRAVWELLHKLRSDVPPLYAFGIFRPIMPCGVGACQACMVPMEGGAKLACTDGPALDLAKVIIS
ncbi:MAG TPA: hypothetical protein VKA67_03950, partial [Verrucomicrobiae bacterium]|nr:hypothetical protein [Verrucomicrobiae bacterium]